MQLSQFHFFRFLVNFSGIELTFHFQVFHGKGNPVICCAAEALSALISIRFSSVVITTSHLFHALSTWKTKAFCLATGRIGVKVGCMRVRGKRGRGSRYSYHDLNNKIHSWTRLLTKKRLK